MRSNKAEVITVLDGHTMMISLYGDIDHHSAKRIRGEIDSSLYINRPKRAVMNMASVEFMDSAGLGLIIGRLAVAEKIKCKLTILSPSPQVMKILDLAGAGRLVEIQRADDDVPAESKSKAKAEK
ncbi:MAG: anti-sigma factor antagonist [Firmicutes bacterium]|nr:anti-sigma factor antagonist [Bacillota bacterium]